MGGGISRADIDDIIEKAKCAKCKFYLSKGPIKIQVNGTNICGRCIPSSGIQNVGYENVLQKIPFPCCFKKSGCKSSVKLGQLVDHEEVCNYRTYRCLASSCTWKGPACDLHLHFSKNHTVLVDPIFKLGLSTDDKNNLMYKKGEDVLLFQYVFKYQTKLLYLVVSYIPFDAFKTISCNFQIVNDEKKELYVNLKKYDCKPIFRAVDVLNMSDINIGKYLDILEKPKAVQIKIVFTEKK